MWREHIDDAFKKVLREVKSGSPVIADGLSLNIPCGMVEHLMEKGALWMKQEWLEHERLDRIQGAADRGNEHYGQYGTACINTGQFDAGECWKCKIRALEAENKSLRHSLRQADDKLERQDPACPRCNRGILRGSTIVWHEGRCYHGGCAPNK